MFQVSMAYLDFYNKTTKLVLGKSIFYVINLILNQLYHLKNNLYLHIFDHLIYLIFNPKLSN